MCFTSEMKSLSTNVYAETQPCKCTQSWLLSPTQFLCKPKVSSSPDSNYHAYPVSYTMTKFESSIAAHIMLRKIIFQHSWPQGNTTLVSELNVDRQRPLGLSECQGRVRKKFQVQSSGPLGLPSPPKLQLLTFSHFNHGGFLISVPDQVTATPLNKCHTASTKPLSTTERLKGLSDTSSSSRAVSPLHQAFRLSQEGSWVPMVLCRCSRANPDFNTSDTQMAPA